MFVLTSGVEYNCANAIRSGRGMLSSYVYVCPQYMISLLWGPVGKQALRSALGPRSLVYRQEPESTRDTHLSSRKKNMLYEAEFKIVIWYPVV